ERILLRKIIGDGLHAGIVEIFLVRIRRVLSGGGGVVKCADDLGLALGGGGFAAGLGQADEKLIVVRGAIALNAGVAQARSVQVGANLVDVRRGGKTDISVGATAEVHAQRDVVPEQHREYAGDAEDEREAEEMPLLA